MESHTAKLSWLFAGAFGLFITASIPAFAQQQVGKRFQPLNVKPGLWQTTTTYKLAGELPIPPGALENMTPEQRARVEENMKANGETQTLSDKHCVTQEELQNPFNGEHCTWTILDSTSTSAKGTVACEEQGMQLTGSGQFEVLDQEHMKGSAHLTSTGGSHTMTTDATFKSQWLGASCGNVK